MNDALLSRVRVQVPSRPGERTSAEYLRHQAVASLFLGQDEARPLYRVLEESGGASTLLVLSSVPPRRTSEIAPGRWVGEVVTKRFAPPLKPGQGVDFDLVVNAASVVTDGAGRKRRVDVWDVVFASKDHEDVDRADVYAAWLSRQLNGAAELVSGQVAERGLMRVRRPGREAPMVFVRTRIIGALTVRQPAELTALLVRGIGRARAFGCGLMCLLPAGRLHRRP
ncbi:MAG: type I-E CRISPR-associated protein Cas6/Cse3/CasE [Gemmatimonadales bacterium]|nr:type I-E CRISPR-associated protein Cas6/Cse3/CasE [Gemmatimonadales bacterium]